MIEYTKLETRTEANNQASTQLVNLIFWWESLNFVERKMAKHKNMRVSTTEAAALAEVKLVFALPSAQPDGVDEEEDPTKCTCTGACGYNRPFAHQICR